MSFHVGQTVGDYSVTALLGAGSMGRVYRVEHSLTRRVEAMKVLAAELATDIQIKRFEREMRALAKLNHPNIAALHQAAHTENQLILFMEYIEGPTLESLFAAGRLPLEEGVAYIQQVLAALDYAHQRGVVHRDVTPANVIVTAHGQVKLTDFGLSKSYGDSLLTNCGEILGSLPYLAPEQLKGTTQPDRRSDLYSVGAILYEHLTGRKPFGEKRRLAPVLTDSEADPQPPSEVEPGLARQWDDLLRRALARDPAHRYQSAEEFVGAIAKLEHPAVSDFPLPSLRTLGIAVASFAGLILALAASSAVLRSHAPMPPAPSGRLHISPPPFASAKSSPAEPRRVHPPVRAMVVKAGKPHGIAPAPAALEADEAPVTPTPSEPVAEAAAPATPAQPAPETTQNPAPAKKGFWSKLNVFHNRHADAQEKQ
jgi:eukaryotic-like serine/threonine-protein kinase